MGTQTRLLWAGLWDRLWWPQDRCYKKMRGWISEAPWPSYMPPGTSETAVWCGEKTIGLMVKVSSVIYYLCNLGLPRWLSDKESTCQARDMGFIPGLERSPGEGNGNPLQYSCLGNPLDRGACWATVHGVTESDMFYWLNSSTLGQKNLCISVSLCIKWE